MTTEIHRRTICLRRYRVVPVVRLFNETLSAVLPSGKSFRAVSGVIRWVAAGKIFHFIRKNTFDKATSIITTCLPYKFFGGRNRVNAFGNLTIIGSLQ